MPRTKRTMPVPIVAPNRAARRRAKATPEAAPVVEAPAKPIKRLNHAEHVGLRAALANRDQAGAQYEVANNAVAAVMKALKLDPAKEYPLGENGEVYPPQP